MPEGSARFLREFVSEGETLLAQAEEHLSVLSEGSEDPAPQTLNALFRAVHSLKGVAGMVGLPAFAEAAHAFESLLDAVRRGQLPFDLVVANATRKSVEALRKGVAEVAKKGSDAAFPPLYFALIEKARVPRVTVVRPEPEVSLPPDLAAVISEYERTR
ncbi:MAG: Hpt domain-containing protein, partial [Acidobacteria bacterium]|nr:Hpt domain-containing protein [Acidobacteriota bacterium]